MRLNYGKLFQEKIKNTSVSKVLHIPSDPKLWPPAWTTVYYKTYERFRSIVLPAPVPRSFGHTELVARKSVREFGVFNKETLQKEYKAITLPQISNILYYSCGEVYKSPDKNRSRRIQPSAGGRYSVEAYILNFEQGDLAKKCYHYNVQNHTLEELWDIPMTSRKDISKYIGCDWSTDVSMVIVLSAVIERVTMKYGERGYKFMYLEAGAILNSLHVNSALEGLGSCIMGDTNEVAIEELLDLDGEKETVVLSIVIG